MTPTNIAKIENLLFLHREGMSRDELARYFGIKSASQLSSFIGVMRRLGVKIPVSPNLRNGGKRVIFTSDRSYRREDNGTRV